MQDCSAAISLVQRLSTRLGQDDRSGCPDQHERELQAGMLTKPSGQQQPALATASTGAATPTAGDADAGDPAAAAVDADGPPAAAKAPRDALPQCTPTSSSSLEAPAETSSEASLAKQLRVQLVKLLARRAAAHVEMQQLQEAQQDLQHGLRCVVAGWGMCCLAHTDLSSVANMMPCCVTHGKDDEATAQARACL